MVKGRLIFVTGGARSGKSRLAQAMAEKAPGRKLYIATARARDNDAEMAERIRKHREARGTEWDTAEGPDDPASILMGLAGLEGPENYGAVLIDCLTLWLSNRMEAGADDPEIIEEARVLAAVCKKAPATVIAVSNEVGLGIIPENALARRFRDLAGLVNQTFAAEAEEAYLAASGLPLRLK
jgi:adenosylcobinamide kinase/adenosylcobinamide-phosphate guanylyltransferase